MNKVKWINISYRMAPILSLGSWLWFRKCVQKASDLTSQEYAHLNFSMASSYMMQNMAEAQYNCLLCGEYFPKHLIIATQEYNPLTYIFSISSDKTFSFILNTNILNQQVYFFYSSFWISYRISIMLAIWDRIKWKVFEKNFSHCPL